MRKVWFVRTVAAMALVSVFLIGRPEMFAHAQPPSPHGGRAGASAQFVNGYTHLFALANMITGRCPADTAGGLFSDGRCNGSNEDLWGFTRDKVENGNEIGTLQNLGTARCLDDSNVGLRANGCDQSHGDLRKFQQFKLTYVPGDHAYELQNMATGSCVDDSVQDGLRGKICNHTYFQKWL